MLVHGRDQDRAYMREHLLAPLALPDVDSVLPEAPGGSWYPGRFHDPLEANEPWLSEALTTLDGLPVFVSAGRHDEWIALEHIEATARAFEAAGARVEVALTDDPEHRITAEAVAGVRRLLVTARS